MIQKYSPLLILGILLLTAISVNAKPAENEHGIVDAWIKFHDGEWQQPTTDTYHLKIKESFQIKVTITAKVDGYVNPEIAGSGVTQAYEVVDGPSKIDQTLYGWDFNPVSEGWNETFIWTVRPNGEWTDGTAGLNLYVDINPNADIGDQSQIAFGLINAYIEDEVWEGYSPDNGNNNENDNTSDNGESNNSKNTPGFEIILLFIAIIILLFTTRKRRP